MRYTPFFTRRERIRRPTEVDTLRCEQGCCVCVQNLSGMFVLALALGRCIRPFQRTGRVGTMQWCWSMSAREKKKAISFRCTYLLLPQEVGPLGDKVFQFITGRHSLSCLLSLCKLRPSFTSAAIQGTWAFFLDILFCSSRIIVNSCLFHIFTTLPFLCHWIEFLTKLSGLHFLLVWFGYACEFTPIINFYNRAQHQHRLLVV